MLRAPFLVAATACLTFASQVEAQSTFLEPDRAVRDVVTTLRERLDLMEHVAAWKDARRLPVEALQREREVLDATVTAAQALGLEPKAARILFELQIRFAREAQQEWIAAWRAGAQRPSRERDLDSDLRPALDRLGERLLVEIYLASPELARADFTSRYRAETLRLVTRGVNQEDARKLLAALGRLRTIPGPLMPRLAAGRVLRIGMTGDYAPFSVERNGEVTGVDVELSDALARSLGARAILVRTSWPTLLDDYRAGFFDVAMSGISVTTERAAVARFSRPYHRGGKTPIVRCGREASLDTLAEIDHPKVRVIVNPGGTNERFARERLAHAQLRIHADNRTIFDELVLDHADVMVTDDVEVELQTRHHRELCRATPEVFSISEKAILMPREAALEDAVDRWLAEQIANGEIERQLEKALAR